jgi:hypothetical protein
MWNKNNPEHLPPRWKHESLITAVAFGGFLIVLGLVFVLTPDLPDKISSFFRDITTRQLPFGGGQNTISLLAPANPSSHSALYTAVMQFDIGIAILQVIVLAMRLGLQSRARRVAETVGNLVFWGGAAFLVYYFLQMGTLRSWFEYWAALIIVVGVSLVIRSIIHFVSRR